MKSSKNPLSSLRAKTPLLAQMVPFLLALACARAWTSLTFAGSQSGLGAPSPAHDLFDLAYCGIAVVVALGVRRMLPFFERAWTKPAALACMLASSVCWTVQACGVAVDPLLSHAGALLGGAGFSLFLLLWSETLCGVTVVRIVLYTSAAMLCGSVIAFFVEGMDLLRTATAILLLPLVAFAALSYAHATLQASARQVSSCPEFRHPWKLYALFGIWAFAYGLRSSQLAAGAGMHSSLSTAIVAGALFLFVLLFADRFGLKALYRSPVLLTVCGFMLIPLEGFIGPAASSYLISMGYTLMSVLVSLLLYDISKRMGIAIVAMVSVKNALQAFVLAGNDVSRVLDAAFQHDVANQVMAYAVILIVALSMVLLFSERDLASKWGVTVFSGDGFVVEEEARDLAREDACGKLAERFNLSPREKELLPLLASGRTNRQIAEELYIAEGTCKAHTRHIYEKMGIHSRKELHAIVDSARESAV